MTAPAEEDDFTELVDFHPDRVDLVKTAANGTRFLIAKQDASAGLLDPDFVRGLISKSEDTREVTMPTTLPNGITLTGSPADVAAFIHKASVRQAEREATGTGDVAKADLSTKDLNDLPDSAFAYIEPGGKKDASGKTTPRSLRHFAIQDKAHADNAAARIAQGAKFGDKAKAKVEAAQRKFGEKKVSKEAGVPDQVTKADPGDALEAATDDGVDGLDPTVPAAAPDGLDGIPGDPADPGSAAWEAVDSATAAKWCMILSGARRAVCWLKDREMLEAATADPDDAENACDLDSTCDALDYVIGILAPYAVSEQSESDRLAFEAEVSKSVADPVSLPAAVVAIAKAGRVLSTANEGRIRQAAGHLNDVLASLPQALPEGGNAAVTKEEGAVPDTSKPAEVAKASDAAPETAPEAAETVEKAKDHPGTGAPMEGTGHPADGTMSPEIGNAPVAKSAPVAILYDAAGELLGVAPSEAVSMRVAKADSGDDAKPAMTAVFDADGNLIGICDPSAITPVAGAGKKAEPEAKPEDAPADAPAPEASGGADTAPDGTDLEPQPSADAGTPAGAAPAADEDDDNVAKAQGPGADQDTEPSLVLKSIAQLQQAFADSEAARQEAITKMAAGQAEEIATLKARLEQVESQPAAPKVFTNGATPPTGGRPMPTQLRGQDADAPLGRIDIAKAAERKQELYHAPDARRQNEVALEMQGDAIAALAAIHGRQ